MGYKYHDSLVEAVGSSFYYYTNHENFDITNAKHVDFEEFTKGWIKEYQGDWDRYSSNMPITYNTFKPCVDQLVYRILAATEDEISRRVNEEVSRHIDKLHK